MGWMRQSTWGVALLVMVAGLLTGCPEGSQSSAELAGSINDNVYRNDALGFEVTLPEGWHQPSAEAQREMMQMGTEMVAGDDPAMKSLVDTSMQETGTLLMLFEHPYGAPVDFNTNISFVGERVGHQPGITTPQAYMFHLKRVLTQPHMTYQITRDITPMKLDGIDACDMQANFTIAGQTVQQRLIAVLRGEHALVITLSYGSPEAAATLDQIVQSVKFD